MRKWHRLSHYLYYALARNEGDDANVAKLFRRAAIRDPRASHLSIAH
jgi:hypothetical protein